MPTKLPQSALEAESRRFVAASTHRNESERKRLQALADQHLRDARQEVTCERCGHTFKYFHQQHNQVEG
jgi:hypothetical protein